MDGGAPASEFHLVPGEGALRLFVRLRRPARPRRAALFVHGATLASSLFDVARQGASWLAYAAARGIAAYALDIRGYGRSTGVAAMDAPAPDNEPVATGDEAARDIALIVDWIRAREGVERVALIGGSWGSITAARHAIARPETVERLVLSAPIFAETNRPWLDLIGDPAKLPAWRLSSVADNRRRWDSEIVAAGATPDDWRDPAVFDALMADCLAADPLAATRTPPAFRVPNGTLVDLHAAFSGRPVYAPERIEGPTLLIRGAADPTSTATDARALLARLKRGRLVEIADAAHFLCAERRAPLLFEAVQRFLDEPDGGW